MTPQLTNEEIIKKKGLNYYYDLESKLDYSKNINTPLLWIDDNNVLRDPEKLAVWIKDITDLVNHLKNELSKKTL